jgi:peptidoglycan hydrolase-like protein with peptidoglycan-binding domain
MKNLLLATLATVALSVPALAQQHAKGAGTPNGQSNMSNSNMSQYQANTNQISPNCLRTSQVREIQQTLESKGEKGGRVDGKWGPETEAALKDFQKSQNVPASGQLDPATIAGLGLNPAEFGLAASSSTGTTDQAPKGNNTRLHND